MGYLFSNLSAISYSNTFTDLPQKCTHIFLLLCIQSNLNTFHILWPPLQYSHYLRGSTNSLKNSSIILKNDPYFDEVFSILLINWHFSMFKRAGILSDRKSKFYCEIFYVVISGLFNLLHLFFTFLGLRNWSLFRSQNWERKKSKIGHTNMETASKNVYVREFRK